MKKKVWKAFILLFFCMFTPLLLQAQTEEEKKIKKVLQIEWEIKGH